MERNISQIKEEASDTRKAEGEARPKQTEEENAEKEECDGSWIHTHTHTLVAH